MDKFEKRLLDDADAIEAGVSPELRMRIDASLRGVGPVKPVTHVSNSSTRFWWASSLTGLVAAIAIIAYINLDRSAPVIENDAGNELVVQHRTVPETPRDTVLLQPLLDIQSADFAAPLEEELQKLQSDLEKARKSVREDVDFTF